MPRPISTIYFLTFWIRLSLPYYEPTVMQKMPECSITSFDVVSLEITQRMGHGGWYFEMQMACSLKLENRIIILASSMNAACTALLLIDCTTEIGFEFSSKIDCLRLYLTSYF